MPFNAETENPWKKRDKIPYPRTGKLIPFVLIYVLAALVPIFLASEKIALIAYVGLIAGVIYVLRMPRIVISVVLASFIPIAFFGSFSIGTMALAMVAGTGCGAVLMTSMHAPWRTVALPLLAWVIAFAITRDAAMACLTLIPLPAVLLLAGATVMGQRRTTAICYTLGGFLVSVLALLAVYFLMTYGSIGRDVIVEHFETQREWIVRILTSYKDEILKLFSEQGMQGSDAYSALQTLMSRENLVTLVAMVYNILPALVIVVCSILAYEAQSLLCGSYCTLGMKQMLTPASTAFTMSAASAILYLLAFLITAIVPAEGLFMAVVQNFYLILTPGLFLIGWAGILYRFRTAQGGSKVFLVILAVVVILFAPSAIFSLLAFFGAVTVLLSTFGTHMMKKMQDRMGAEQSNDRQDEEEKNDPKDDRKDN